MRRTLMFEVAPEMVEQYQEWSGPVEFRFEEQGDGTVVLVLRSWMFGVEPIDAADGIRLPEKSGAHFLPTSGANPQQNRP